MERIADASGSSIQDLVDALLEEFAGPIGLAKEVRLEYAARDRGDQYRIRLLTLVLELFKEHGGSESADQFDLSALLEEESRLATQVGDDDENEW
jgi:hypothetical protein